MRCALQEDAGGQTIHTWQAVHPRLGYRLLLGGGGFVSFLNLPPRRRFKGACERSLGKSSFHTVKQLVEKQLVNLLHRLLFHKLLGSVADHHQDVVCG